MPSKNNTRRAISVRGVTYQRLQDHCSEIGISISGYLEKIIADNLDARGVPQVVAAQVPATKPTTLSPTEGVGGVHNF